MQGEVRAGVLEPRKLLSRCGLRTRPRRGMHQTTLLLTHPSAVRLAPAHALTSLQPPPLASPPLRGATAQPRRREDHCRLAASSSSLRLPFRPRLPSVSPSRLPCDGPFGHVREEGAGGGASAHPPPPHGATTAADPVCRCPLPGAAGGTPPPGRFVWPPRRHRLLGRRPSPGGWLINRRPAAAAAAAAGAPPGGCGPRQWRR